MPEASLDTWTSVFFVVSLFGLFFSSLFFMKGTHYFRSVWPIPVLILGFSIVLFQYSLFWTGYIQSFPFLNFSLSAWFLSFGPLIFIYTSSFCRAPVNKPFVHFIPAIISLVMSFMFYLRYFGVSIFTNESYALEVLYYVNNQWVAVFSMLLYLLFSVRVWRKSKHRATQTIVGNWVTMLHGSFLLFIASFVSYYVLVRFPFFNQHWDYGIAAGMSISVFTIGVFVYYEPALFNGELAWLTKETQLDSFSDENNALFYAEITSLIQTKKLFLDGDLRLSHISNAVGLSIHDASKIINLHSGKNFNQFINEFRVDWAEQLLKSTELSVKEICFASGFNSKVSFYAAFKLKTNQTPSEYRKAQQFKS